MYAIIQTGGRQFRVEPGMEVELDRLEAAPGTVVTLPESVLLLSDDQGVRVGVPVIAGAAVALEVLEHLRGDKLVVFKMKRRKRYRRKQGHRQELTKVRVKEITIS